MAYASSLEETRDDVLTCQICFDPYVSPKALPCLHTFCQACLEDYAETRLVDIYGQFPCPTCRKDIYLDSGGIAALPDNFIMGKVKELLNQPRVQSGAVDECSICSSVDEAVSSAATHHCFECDKKLCDKCHRLHRQVSVTRDHHTEQIDKAGEAFHCKRHPKNRVEYYCGSHHVCICVTCTMHQHQMCGDVIPLQVAKEGRVHSLLQLVSEIEEKQEKLQKKRSYYQTLLDNITIRLNMLDTDADKAATMITMALSTLESSHSAEFLSVTDAIEQQLKEYLALGTSEGGDGDSLSLGHQIPVSEQVPGNINHAEDGDDGEDGRDTKRCRVMHSFRVPGGKKDCAGVLVASTSRCIAVSQATSDTVHIFTKQGRLIGEYKCSTKEGLCSYGDNFASLSVSPRLLGLGTTACTFVEYNAKGGIVAIVRLSTGWFDGKPQGLQADQNQIYVTFKNKSVKVFDRNGEAIKSFTLSVSSEYLDLIYFAVSGDFMYISDANDQSVIKCNLDGDMVKKINIAPTWMASTIKLGGLCLLDGEGRILLTDITNNQLYLYDSQDPQQPKHLLGIADGIHKPHDITLTDCGALVIAQEHTCGPQVVIIQDFESVLQDHFSSQQGSAASRQSKCNIQ